MMIDMVDSYRQRARKRLISLAQYIKKYPNHKLTRYLQGNCPEIDGMKYYLLKFKKEYWVPGGAFPGGFARIRICDYTKLSGGWFYPFKELKSVDFIMKYKREIDRKNIYNFPYRFHEKYDMTTYVNEEKCSRSELTDIEVEELISLMTPVEYSKYIRKINKTDIDLWPTIETPIKVRIDGIDDGAEEALFGSLEDAENAILEIAFFQGWDHTRQDMGFKFTD